MPARSRFRGARRDGVTLMELLVVISIIVILSTALYTVLRSIRVSFFHAQNRVDILMTTRIILAAIRNDLRNATEKPEGQINDKKHILYIPMKDKHTGKDKIMIYLFDEDARRLFRNEKPDRGSDDPPAGDRTWRPFLFDDGQILKFEFDNSYRDAEAYAESELSLNAKVWFKVTMKILYTEKYKALTDADREKIARDPDDPRVKTFVMMITPRRVNWLLQATQ